MKQYSPLDIINTILLEGMKVVGDLFGSGQMQFQRRRLQDRKHLLTYKSVQPLAGEALARWLAVVDGTA